MEDYRFPSPNPDPFNFVFTASVIVPVLCHHSLFINTGYFVPVLCHHFPSSTQDILSETLAFFTSRKQSIIQSSFIFLHIFLWKKMLQMFGNRPPKNNNNKKEKKKGPSFTKRCIFLYRTWPVSLHCVFFYHLTSRKMNWSAWSQSVAFVLINLNRRSPLRCRITYMYGSLVS